MFKKRTKSAKKVAKEEKKKDGSSTKVYKQKTTNKRATAGHHEAKCDQRSDQQQHHLESNSVEQYKYTEAISKDVVETSSTHSTADSNGQISDGKNLNRRTYSLEKVSRSLDEVMASGKAILDALSSANLKGINSQKTMENKFMATTETNSRADLRKRGTYDLDKVSDLLDSSVENGSVMEQSLNGVSQVSLSTSRIQRNTYDLDSVSTKLDESIKHDSSLEEVLYDLTDRIQHNSSSSSNKKRGTYDLGNVSSSIDDSINCGKSIQDSLGQVATLESDISPKFNNKRRGTYDLSDVSKQLDQSHAQSGSLNQDSGSNTPQDKTVRRGTYNLVDVSDELDDSINSGKSIDDSLDQISSVELKRRTYDLTDTNLGLQTLENVIDNNNTINDDKQEQNSDEISIKNSENLSVLGHGVESGKRNTYSLEDATKHGLGGVNSENLTENGWQDDSKPLDGLLSVLNLDSEDGRQETELTPGEWMEQMEGLTTTADVSQVKPQLSAKKLDSKKSKVKLTKQISEVTLVEAKQRSQTIFSASSASEFNSQLDYELQTRSLSDPKVKLKSSSTPNFSTSSSVSQNVSKSESLEDISPGIRNYLANKLGLSEEQCMAVHRRLSSGSDTAADTGKLANRKTYSLDDVAQSLDIATSQGLPMTEVLDNLDATTNKKETDTTLANVTDENLKSDTISNNFDEPNTESASGDNDATIKRPEGLNLNKTIPQEAWKAGKPNTLANGTSLVNNSPIAKSPTTSFDNQFKLIRKKAVYKPSAKLQSFSHLLGGKGGDTPLRRTRGRTDPLKRNTYTLESVAESLEKAQDAGVTMLDALKRLSGSCQGVQSELPDEKRKTYDLEDVSKTLETGVAAGVAIVDTLRTIADPSSLQDEENDEGEVIETTKQQAKKTPPPKPKRTFSTSNKPEIKFVSDSFVIEYFTSPQRSESTSAEPGQSKRKENYYVNAVVSIDSKPVSPSVKESKQLSNLPKPKNTVDQKPTTKVVNDLDTLLSKLAAEVEKPTNVAAKTESSSTSTVVVSRQDTGSGMQGKDKIEIKTEPSLPCPVVEHPTAVSSVKANGIPDEDKFEVVSAENQRNTTVTEDRQIETQNRSPLASNLKSLNTAEDFCDQKMEKIESIAKPSSKNIDLNNANYSVNNNEIEADSLKVVLNEELILSNAKVDDEGYCSLSRKPGKVKQETQFGSLDLFKKENMVSGVKEDLVVTEGKAESKVQVVRSYDGDGEIQEAEIVFAAESDTEVQVIAHSDQGDSAPKAVLVSRELNLLRLRLAEKQRDIEAQKQRSKEQLEEERKRFGQNVFWLAVGKGRERKEGGETKIASKQADFEQHLATISSQPGNTSNLDPSTNKKFATFVKQSSADEELPPSMGKLRDRTFHIKTNNETLSKNKSIPEEKTLSNEYFAPNGEENVKHSSGVRNHSFEDRESSVDSRNPSVEDRNLSDDVVQFRLSRQVPGTQEIFPNKEQPQTKSFSGNSDYESQKSEKSKTPVLNYKSRMNVPATFQAKQNSESNTADNFQIKISENLADRQVQGNGDFHDLETNFKGTVKPPTSPQRKCWNTETDLNNEPCIAVSESNYHLFDHNVDRVSRNSAVDVSVKAGGSMQSPGEDECDSGNLNSSPRDDDTPKKGLALFIGEENTVSNDGLTPEQLKKREKFLRNRQQKIEEDKMKKEALLEKKRRKEEKMREIQLRRDQEEQSRQAKLQEKQKQAEHAKQERQKYEMRRKENLPRTNFIDGTPGGNAGYTRTPVDTPSYGEVPAGHGGYARIPANRGNAFEIPLPAQAATPSAFSGFSGVQSYVRPSGKTNRKLIINAISHVCLPGAVNKDTKDKCLQAMTESSAQHFLILFKEGLKFRALYSLDLESSQVLKVHGIGPRSVTEKMIDQLYKYNSGGKEFTKIPAKSFSLSVDGFTLQKSCWQSSKPAVPSKTSSNFKQTTYRSAR